MNFGEWLSSTKELQEQAFGVDYSALWDSPDALADYMLYNLYALTDEVAEVGREIGWKPWAKDRGFVRQDAVIDEVVDVMHFLSNILCAAGVTGEQLAKAYRSKQDENRRRMASGTYTQRKDGQ